MRGPAIFCVLLILAAPVFAQDAAPAAAPEITDCDRLAAGAFDDGRVAEPTLLEDMDPKLALPACRAAVAADPDNLRLQYQLARSLEVDGNLTEAFAIYLKAAEAGYPAAMNGVGRLYVEGRGTALDLDLALVWYGKAALLGDVAAITNLGAIYENGPEGFRVDKATAYLWYKIAADRGYGVAQSELGYAYATGQGIGEDLEQARLWWEKAAAQDEPSAYFNLGYIYEAGLGVETDIPRAARYYYDSLRLKYPNILDSFADSPQALGADLWLEMEKLIAANGGTITPDGEPDADTVAALAALGGVEPESAVARYEAAMTAPSAETPAQ